MEPRDGSKEGSQPETGLEEAMWQMGLESGGGSDTRESYPERPNEADCIYYLRTGFCGYGDRCRFNHPRDRTTVIGAAGVGAGEFPQRVGQPICQYYMRTGMCKFGASCKYHHPKQRHDSTSPVALNYHGYPLRLGEKECSYYAKTGECKFGSTCKFHHPQPVGLQVQVPPGLSMVQVGPQPMPIPMPLPMPTSSLYPPMQSSSGPSSQQYGFVVARPSMLPPYVPDPYGHFLLSPSTVPFQGWSPHQVPLSQVPSSGTQPTTGSGSLYGITQLSPLAAAYTGPFQSSLSSASPLISAQKEQLLPERPGQPDCQHYLKTGDCKFGSSCKYHHPPDLITQNTNIILGAAPFQPDPARCRHFAQYGECKFGPACKFDHSMNQQSHSPSRFSMIVSYSSGSSSGTLAPSSSSSELRDEPNSIQSVPQGHNQSI
ncbi:hypothetical protein SAY87_023733 [Trapa incisa]|uniref:C3H1-type domain-containing protein n=1 Tax=Trapa incisa TaxID=236973 RepID=A0AAN7QRL0_9MYRT|nr:hypothetical protein SAY87_023733 [Trapa incisa]